MKKATYPEASDMAPTRRIMQGRLAFTVPRIDHADLRVHQQRHAVRITALGRKMQRSAPAYRILAVQVGLEARLEQRG